MSYIGQTLPADTFQGFVTDKFTGDGTANKTFTLSKTPFNESAILVTIDGVVQEATDDFTVSGTTLTLVGTAPNNSEVNAIHIGGALPIGQAASLDLNGASDQLILDADADTTISADTDDQIDFKAGGTDVMSMTATGLTINDGTTITTADNTDTLSLISTDTDDNSGPNLRMYRNSGSPGDNYVIGQIQFEGKNDAAEDVVYNDISMKIADASDGTEDGIIRLRNMQAGTLRQYISTSGTEVVINEDSVDIDFRVESADRASMLNVDAGLNKVGIGDVPDLGFAHVKVADSGASVDANYDTLVLEESGHGGIQILTGTSSTGLISFNDSGGTNRGYFGYAHSADRMEFATAAAERMRITSDGYVGINNTSPSATLEVHTNNNITAFETQPKVNQNYYAALFRNSSGNDVGNIESTASSTSFGTSSDYRLKENVDYTWDATTRLKQLKPARFNWIVDDTNTLVDGFLAHEVSSIVPEAISGEKDGTETRTKVVLDASGNQLARNVEEADWVKGKEDETFPSDSTWEASKVYPKHQSIDQSKLVPLMVKTIQELEARIKTLEDA
jgi:hypothetical protein